MAKNMSRKAGPRGAGRTRLQAAVEAAVDTGGGVLRGSSGRWASDRFGAAVKAGREITSAELRTNDTLRKNEWEHLDEALVEDAMIRLNGIADLQRAGLVIPVPGALGRTLFQYEKVTDMEPAEVSLSGVSRTEGDRQEFSLNSVPMPLTHKDFDLNLRTLAASRNRGEALDTTQVRTAGRLVAERLEKMLFQGGPTFGGHKIYGLVGSGGHPDRNLAQFSTGGELWSAAGHDGADILLDVLAMITALEADRMYGPYHLYVPTNFSVKLDDDFKANSDLTIKQRILQIDKIKKVSVADQLPASKVVMVQMSRETVALVDGEPLQTVQWDSEGGFIVKMKAWALQIPLVRSDSDGRCGVVEMNATGT